MNQFDRRTFDAINLHEARATYMASFSMKQQEWCKLAQDYLQSAQAEVHAWESEWAADRFDSMKYALRLWLDNIMNLLEEDVLKRGSFIAWLCYGKFQRISEVTEFFSEEGARQVASIFLEEKELLRTNPPRA